MAYNETTHEEIDAFKTRLSWHSEEIHDIYAANMNNEEDLYVLLGDALCEMYDDVIGLLKSLAETVEDKREILHTIYIPEFEKIEEEVNMTGYHAGYNPIVLFFTECAPRTNRIREC
jgi:hypothetical protein